MGEPSMKMHQVSDHCFAVLNETNLVCDANSGLINLSNETDRPRGKGLQP
jgi:hypothetical protein